MSENEFEPTYNHVGIPIIKIMTELETSDGHLVDGTMDKFKSKLKICLDGIIPDYDKYEMDKLFRDIYGFLVDAKFWKYINHDDKTEFVLQLPTIII